MQIIRSLRELDRARGEWDALAARLENPFLGYDWLRSCAETLHEEGQLRIVALHAADGIAAIAPLAAVRGPGHARLELLGTFVLLEPSGFLYASTDALTTLVEGLVRLGEPLVLRGLDEHGDTGRAIQKVLARRGLGVVLTRRTRASLMLPIRTEWPEYFESLPSKMRQDLRRFASRARAMGVTRVEMLAPTSAEVPRLMEMFVAVEGSGWKARHGASLATNERLLRFVRAFACRVAERGELRVGLLHIGARLAAMQICVEAYRRLWVLKMGFDEAVGWCSPGFQLMNESIRYAHEQRLVAFEFLGTAAAWQERWRPTARAYVSALVYPATLRGLSGLAMDALSFGPARLIGQLQARASAARRTRS